MDTLNEQEMAQTSVLALAHKRPGPPLAFDLPRWRLSVFARLSQLTRVLASVNPALLRLVGCEKVILKEKKKPPTFSDRVTTSLSGSTKQNKKDSPRL